MMINLKLLFDKETQFLRKILFNQDNLSYVYLINKQNKVFKKQIEVGIKLDGMVEILNGKLC